MAMETHNRVVYEGEPVRQEERREETIQREEPRGASVAKGGTALAAFAGLGAIVLAILGLVNLMPLLMAGVAAIVVGAALLLEGGSTAAWFTGARERFVEFAEGGIGAQAMGGIGAIVLGILALVGINSEILLPVAVLVLGTSLCVSGFSSGYGSSGKTFIGLASIVLGILGLVGYAPMTLTLVAFLCLGCASLLSGGLFGARMMSRTA